MVFGIKELIQKIYFLRSQNLQFIYSIYLRGIYINNISIIDIKIIISEENNENDSNCDDDDENKSFILVVPFLFKNNDFIQYL